MARAATGAAPPILLATWGDDGNAGSVAVNSNSAITVNGTGTGIPAVSIGGAGGAFGLFASAASAGGDGGNGADVTVMLASQLSIVTHGAGARRLCAERRRQWWIRGSGVPGGDAGLIIISKTSNINSLGDATIVIHPTGDMAMGILAQSIGGNGGNSVVAALGGVTGSVALGGAAGTGGTASTVIVGNLARCSPHGCRCCSSGPGGGHDAG